MYSGDGSEKLAEAILYSKDRVSTSTITGHGTKIKVDNLTAMIRNLQVAKKARCMGQWSKALTAVTSTKKFLQICDNGRPINIS